jgi:hypothetical protein
MAGWELVAQLASQLQPRASALVPREGRERRNKVRRRRFILLLDLHDVPAFALHSDNWLMFRALEFDPRRRAVYLGDMGFFNRELGVVLTDNEEDEDEGHDYEQDGGMETLSMSMVLPQMWW